MAVRDEKLADAIARGIESVDPKLILFAPDNTELARAGETHGVQIAREIFADRNYLNDGWLVPRTRPDALLRDPKEAAERVLRMLHEGKVSSVEGRDIDVRGETICVHGDTPGAVEFARELRTQLEREGVGIRARRDVHERAVILSEAKNFRSFSKHTYQNSQRCFASLNITESIDADVNAKIDNRPQSGLVRALGPIDAMMIVIGSMIGSGIFITSAESSRLTGAPGWLLLAWAFAGLLTITGALCCSELATMMPRAGGVYVFLREAYGSSIAFLYGWTLFLVIQTGTIAAVAIAFSKFLGVFVPRVSPDNYLVAPISFGGYAISLSLEQLVAIALIILLTWSNMRGLEVGKIIQNTFTFAKTAALAAVVVIGLSLGWNANSAALGSAWWDSWANGWSPHVAQPGFTFVGGLALALLFGKSMVGPLFAQTAWTNVTFVGSEVRDPGKNLVRAQVGGCGIVVVLYVLANVAYLAVLPFPEIQHAPQNRVAV